VLGRISDQEVLEDSTVRSVGHFTSYVSRGLWREERKIRSSTTNDTRIRKMGWAASWLVTFRLEPT
jgi:hypothetical protein